MSERGACKIVFDMVATEHNLTDEITVRQAVRRYGSDEADFVLYPDRGGKHPHSFAIRSELENGEMFDPDKLYLATDAALRAIAPASTMAHWRCEDRGPAYVKLGLKVAYRGRDLTDWIEAQTVRPTAA